MKSPPKSRSRPVLLRFRWREQGAHTHVRVFAGKNEESFGKCGDLVFRNGEWAAFFKLGHGKAWEHIEFVQEEE